MNKCFISILCLFAFCACGTHHYQISGNDMVLVLRKPDTKKVVMFCSLDGFKPRKAKKVSGNWELEMPANEAFRYFYMVDDEPYLPDCPMKEKDDFGFENCIYDPLL